MIPIVTKETVPAQEIIRVGPFTFTREEAVNLAARLAFVADGNLIDSFENDAVTSWNTTSAFHKAYAAIIGG